MDRLRRAPSSSSSANDPKKKRRNFALWKTSSSEGRNSMDSDDQKISVTSHSDKIVTGLTIPDTFEAPALPSPDSFVAASRDLDFQKLRDNIRRIRKAPSGIEPKNIDAAHDAYKKLREECFEICKRLLQKSQNTRRDESLLEREVVPLETRSTNSGSVTETALPFQVNNQWLSAIHEYKAIQESLSNALRLCLLSTYKSYEPDASESQIRTLFTDKQARANLISRMRDVSVHRMRSEKLDFWPRYIIRFKNYDRLQTELEATEKLFVVADLGISPNMAIREYVIAKNGDTILEFANAASEIHPILRFRVSSHLLAEASPLFSQMLSNSPPTNNASPDMLSELPSAPTRNLFDDGTEVKIYKMPQIELNNDEALTILLHAAHMHNHKVPREIEFSVFVSIAEVCMRYQCTSPLELQVEYQWLPKWLHMAGDENPDGLLLISYAFGLRRIFTRMSKTAILNSLDGDEIQSKERWPQVIRDKIKAVRAAKLAQINECCTNAIEEYYRPPLEDTTSRLTTVGSLVFTTVPRCPKGSHLCDATNLGWLMLVYNELRVLPAISSIPVPKKSQDHPRRSLKELCDALRLMPSAPQVHTGVCDYAPAFRSAINDISNSITGLTLRDITGRNGWALSKHAGPTEDRYADISREGPHELPATIQPKKERISMSSEAAYKILSELDNLDDLQSCAMVNKNFYKAYKRNEVSLLRNIAKVDRNRRRTMSEAAPDVEGLRTGLLTARLDSFEMDDAKSDSDDLYGTSPAASPSNMTSEDVDRLLWPFHHHNVPRSQRSITGTEQNEKFLAGEILRMENKARSDHDNKHLRNEQVRELGPRTTTND
ncbi:hypothetical protein PVAG01_09059 [Phlyctema vagabunda]|uniref:BTB domain-containing protein n=1 Tax=Phlyctema vagabunda TaxID=108571 RepID=A0ABR4P6B9_9HELO